MHGPFVRQEYHRHPGGDGVRSSLPAVTAGIARRGRPQPCTTSGVMSRDKHCEGQERISAATRAGRDPRGQTRDEVPLGFAGERVDFSRHYRCTSSSDERLGGWVFRQDLQINCTGASAQESRRFPGFPEDPPVPPAAAAQRWTRRPTETQLMQMTAVGGAKGNGCAR